MEQEQLKYLKLAIEESQKSVASGSSPFGAVIVKNGEIVAVAHNTVVPDNDPTAHAEVNAIRQAGQKLGTFDLTGCVLYTSCQPCPMCLNAIKWANIKQVYFAATDVDADSIGFRDKHFQSDSDVRLIQLPLQSDAYQVMRDWVQSKTKKPY